MPIAGEPRRAALHIDFDNVFSSLIAVDEWAAWSFAAEPARWLAWLAAGAGEPTPRRILIRRCYLNPAGWAAPEPGGSLANWLGQPRIYFSRFRADFVRAGFEVVDCPRLAKLKNGADILMALDIAETLHHPTHFDEFLILSGDSDFTPLLHRLRAHDRRTLIIAHPATAQALRAATDGVIPLDAFADAALAPNEPLPIAEEPGRPTPLAAIAPAAPVVIDTAAIPDPGDPAAQRAAILGLLRQAVAAADGPLHLPAVGKRIHILGGPWVRGSNFGGAGTLARLLEGAEGLALEAGPGGGWLYDPARHERPSLEQPGLPDDPLAHLLGEMQARLGPGFALPRLGPAELEFGLARLAGMLPLAGMPDPEAVAAMGAEAMAAGLDLQPRAIGALIGWLQRARFDWRQAPDAETPARLARALYAEITRQAAAAGFRLPPEALAMLRDWIGLAPRPAEAPTDRSIEVPLETPA